MKTLIRQPIVNADNTLGCKTIALTDICITNYALLAIDGSTSNSGLALVRQSDGALLYLIKCTREKGEEPVRFKLRLKAFVKDMLARNRFVDQIYYEEPIVEHLSAVKNLFMLRSFVEEMIIENEPDFNYIKNYEVPNTKWKRIFLAPDKLPQGTEKQKAAVMAKVQRNLAFMNPITQDEADAIGLGYAAAMTLKNGGEDAGKELEAKKSRRKFQYNVEFIGADYDDNVFDEFTEIYSGPEKILANGISFTELGKRANFDKHIYEAMGDDDKVLIIKFDSDRHGDVILKYKIGPLSTSYDYIYAIVWRKSRKV